MKVVSMLIPINMLVDDADFWYDPVGRRLMNADVVPNRLAGAELYPHLLIDRSTHSN